MECHLRFVESLTDTTNKVFFVLIYTAVMIISVLGKGIVMFVIITKPRLHQPTYYLIFSLALSDFIITLFGQSTYEISVKDYASCIVDRIIVFLNGANCTTCLMLMCMISRALWLHVAKGSRYNQYTSNKQVVKISLAYLLTSLSVAMPICFKVSYLRVVGTFGFVMIGLSSSIAICFINIKVLVKQTNWSKATLMRWRPIARRKAQLMTQVRSRTKKEQKWSNQSIDPLSL